MRQGSTATGRRPRLLAATLISVGLVASGNLLGLVRDLVLADAFGASAATDAFLVAWTVPETAAPLLIEDAMAFLLVPAFAHAVLAGDAAVRDLLRRTLPRIFAGLVVAGGLAATGAPVLVALLAPGLAEPGLAVTCMRLTSISVLLLGVAGYLASALRAHGVFGPPAAIYVANNVGVIACVVLLSGRLDVVSAALGVAVGGLFMVGVQAPAFLRRVVLPLRGAPPLQAEPAAGVPEPRVGGARAAGAVTAAAVVPLAVYTLVRQAQVFVERFLAAPLPAGTISHLNYATKIAQMPAALTLVIVLVTFPVLARSIAEGRLDDARRRVETDLRTVSALVLPAIAFLVAFAPVAVALLFQRGEFTAADTRDTAAVLRVYACGLLGQVYVGVLCRCFFSRSASWYPAVVMAGGLALTAVLGVGLVGPFGAPGLAAANAAGITLAAVLLLVGARHRVVPVSLPAVGLAVARPLGPAVLALLAGWAWVRAEPGWPPLAVLVTGGLLVVVVVAAGSAVTDREGSRQVLDVLGRGVRRGR